MRENQCARCTNTVVVRPESKQVDTSLVHVFVRVLDIIRASFFGLPDDVCAKLITAKASEKRRMKKSKQVYEFVSALLSSRCERREGREMANRIRRQRRDILVVRFIFGSSDVLYFFDISLCKRPMTTPLVSRFSDKHCPNPKQWEQQRQMKRFLSNSNAWWAVFWNYFSVCLHLQHFRDVESWVNVKPSNTFLLRHRRLKCTQSSFYFLFYWLNKRKKRSRVRRPTTTYTQRMLLRPHILPSM